MSKVKAKGQMDGMKVSRKTFKQLTAPGFQNDYGNGTTLSGTAASKTMKSGPGISCGAGSPHADNANLPKTKKTKGV